MKTLQTVLATLAVNLTLFSIGTALWFHSPEPLVLLFASGVMFAFTFVELDI